MGCTPSRVKSNSERTHTAAISAKNSNEKNHSLADTGFGKLKQIEYKRTESGRLAFEEEFVEEDLTPERGDWPRQETTRRLGKGKLGITVGF